MKSGQRTTIDMIVDSRLRDRPTCLPFLSRITHIHVRTQISVIRFVASLLVSFAYVLGMSRTALTQRSRRCCVTFQKRLLWRLHHWGWYNFDCMCRVVSREGLPKYRNYPGKLAVGLPIHNRSACYYRLPVLTAIKGPQLKKLLLGLWKLFQTACCWKIM